MADLQAGQVLIQNDATGKQTVVAEAVYTKSIANKVSPFHGWSIVPQTKKAKEKTAEEIEAENAEKARLKAEADAKKASAFVPPTQDEIDALNAKMSVEGFKKTSLTAPEKAILKWLKEQGN